MPRIDDYLKIVFTLAFSFFFSLRVAMLLAQAEDVVGAEVEVKVEGVKQQGERLLHIVESSKMIPTFLILKKRML